MSDVNQQQLSQAHAKTCDLMTSFINGYQSPSLAYAIVDHLSRLLTHPQLLASHRQRYLPLLAHWQVIAYSMLEQQIHSQL
jgi:hypothetical protein